VRHATRIGAFAGALLVGVAAAPAAAPPSAAHARELAAWGADLARARRDLEAGRFERARDGATRLLEAMERKLEREEGAAPLLAGAALVRALARGGLGEARAAAWDFALARALDPEPAKAASDSFGRASSVFETLTAGWDAEEAEAQRAIEAAVQADRDGKLSRPLSIGVLQVAPPFRRLEPCGEIEVESRFLIGADGLTRHPVLEAPARAVFAYALIESVRRWAYRPAKIDGRPAPFVMPGGTHFRFSSCPP
jgi:hypothetical protein